MSKKNVDVGLTIERSQIREHPGATLQKIGGVQVTTWYRCSTYPANKHKPSCERPPYRSNFVVWNEKGPLIPEISTSAMCMTRDHLSMRSPEISDWKLFYAWRSNGRHAQHMRKDCRSQYFLYPALDTALCTSTHKPR